MDQAAIAKSKISYTLWKALLFAEAIVFFAFSGQLRFAVADDVDDLVTVRFKVHLPQNTPADATVFIAGNQASLGMWNPSVVQLCRSGDLAVAEIELSTVESVEYKYTLGSWASVEKKSEGLERPNRKLSLQRNIEQVDAPEGDASKRSFDVEDSVEAWSSTDRDAMHIAMPTITGRIDRWWIDWQSIDAQLLPSEVEDQKALEPGSKRELLEVDVWLPKNFGAENDRRASKYPAILFMDGQNVFDRRRASFGREWQADETATNLIRDNAIESVILVSIDHPRGRVRYYTPVAASINALDKAMPDNAGEADRFIDFLSTHLLDQLRSRYPIEDDPCRISIIGSSLGGLVALRTLERFPDKIGNAAALSPSLFWGDEWALTNFFGNVGPEPLPSVHAADNRLRSLWLDTGDTELPDPESASLQVDRLRRIVNRLENEKVNHRLRLGSMVEPGGKHDEDAWARRLPIVLKFLLSDEKRQ